MSYSFWKLELIIIFIINWTHKKRKPMFDTPTGRHTARFVFVFLVLCFDSTQLNECSVSACLYRQYVQTKLTEARFPASFRLMQMEDIWEKLQNQEMQRKTVEQWECWMRRPETEFVRDASEELWWRPEGLNVSMFVGVSRKWFPVGFCQCYFFHYYSASEWHDSEIRILLADVNQQCQWQVAGGCLVKSVAKTSKLPESYVVCMDLVCKHSQTSLQAAVKPWKSTRGFSFIREVSDEKSACLLTRAE